MDPIGSFSGLASGIQWRDMVDQIMKLEKSRKLTPIQSQLALQDKRQKAWGSFGSLVTKLSDAAKQLRDGSAFRAFSTTADKSASGKELLSASASSAAAPGSYRVEVVQLARAEKINGQAYASATERLSLTGDFWINGRRVEVSAADTLTSLRDKINTANSGASPSGVSATILSTGATSHRLILTADNTGSRGIELVDGDTDVLQSVGLLNGTLSRNASVTDSTRTESQRLDSKTTILSTLLGISAPPLQTTVSFGGVKVNVDLSSDTLISVMNRVNSRGGDATMTEESVAGKTFYRLSSAGEVTADADASDPAASQRIVELLGFVQSGRTAQITSGQDAVVRVDGFKLTRRANVVTDAINGVTLDLKAANGSERTSAVAGSGLSIIADPKTIDAGSYDIALTSSSTTRTVASDSEPTLTNASAPEGVADGTYAVELSSTTTRSSSASTAELQVLASPGTVTAGTYRVQVTQAATRATATGSVVAGTYGTSGDSMTIVDNLTGVAKSYALTAGQSLDSVVAGLNHMFTGNGMSLTASNDGGRLKLQHGSYGSASDFLVTVSDSRVSDFFGIGSTGGTSYTGVDVAGSLVNDTTGTSYAASGSGQVLTGSTGAVTGLQVRYTGSTTGSPVGTVTVTDETTVSGGTIGGQAATWDAVNKRLTVASGSLSGVAVTYNGTQTSGTVGNVTVSTTSIADITGVTIGGEAAVWDGDNNVIRGASGSRFEGLELAYGGPAVNGSIGSLTVSGDIGVTVRVNRDTDSTVASVQRFADAYNEVVKFVDEQRKPGSPLNASGAVRSILSSFKDVLLGNVTGLSSATTPYVRAGAAGVALDKEGKLQVDTAKLKESLTTSPTDVERLFSTSGTTSASDLVYRGATAKTQPGTYAVNITQVATAAEQTGNALGASWTYTASNTASDNVLSITDASSGLTRTLTLSNGARLATVVSELNSLFQNEKMSLKAEVSGTSLKLSSTEYGSAAGFTLAGAYATAALGHAAGSWAGQDVQGTFTDQSTNAVITATGVGRALTADSGTAEGLIVQYLGAATGAAGTVAYSLGLSGGMVRAADPVIRAGDGLITQQNDAIDTSNAALNRRITDIQARLEVQRQSLLHQFTRMEAAMNRFQSQGSWLSSQLRALQPPRDS